MNVVAVPLEEWMLGNVDDQVKVPRGRPFEPRLTFACHTHPGPRLNTWGDPDAYRNRPLGVSRSMAGSTNRRKLP